MDEQNNENKLIEGKDFYYTPEGYKCFTEKHHLKRGYCCKSGCRHCLFLFGMELSFWLDGLVVKTKVKPTEIYLLKRKRMQMKKTLTI